MMAFQHVALVAMPLLSADVPSLALASLSAYLRAEGMLVAVHPFNNRLSNDELVGFVRQHHVDAAAGVESFAALAARTDHPTSRSLAVADVTLDACLREVLVGSPSTVGFSAFSSSWLLSLLLARRLRLAAPQTQVVFGGPACHLGNQGELLLQSGFVDALVPGEGEWVLAELLRRRGEGFQGAVPGAVVRSREGKWCEGLPPPPLPMDTLPFPDFRDFDLSRLTRHRDLPLAFGRGCKFGCSFCFERVYWRKYRQMSVGRAMETLHHVRNTYGITSFELAQSLVNADLVWLSAFSDEMIRSEASFLWGGNARVHAGMDREMGQKLYRAGCRFLSFGLESASPTVLRTMGKGANVEDARRTIAACHQAGIWVHAYWIVGFPGESADDLLATLDFVIDNADTMDSCCYHQFSPEPDTPVLKQLPRGDRRQRSRSVSRDGRSTSSGEGSILVCRFRSVLNSLALYPGMGQVDGVRAGADARLSRLYHLVAVMVLRQLLVDDQARALIEPSRFTRASLVEASASLRLDGASLDELQRARDEVGRGVLGVMQAAPTRRP